ncbi:hypothetical protein AB0L65_04570 [Nonomuraea sp. NPDC052116]|uniref:hypothetical protein n=1 Tax=Nonomuraea sp. NPDC052116 TaxID=3155665 RepID=UPI0034443AE1
MLFYCAAVSVSCRSLAHFASIIVRRHCTAGGSRWRKLTSGQQALLVLARLSNGDTYAQAGCDHAKLRCLDERAKGPGCRSRAKGPGCRSIAVARSRLSISARSSPGFTIGALPVPYWDEKGLLVDLLVWFFSVVVRLGGV